MCLGAIYWARPARVYFAANKFRRPRRAGFDDAFIYEQIAVRQADREIPFVETMREESLECFARGRKSRIAWSTDHDFARCIDAVRISSFRAGIRAIPEGASRFIRCYGGAHLFRAALCRKMGAIAERALAEFAPDAATLALAIGIPNRLADTVYERVIEKLRREPVEGFPDRFRRRLRNRPDAEEDATADAGCRGGSERHGGRRAAAISRHPGSSASAKS